MTEKEILFILMLCGWSLIGTIIGWQIGRLTHYIWENRKVGK